MPLVEGPGDGLHAARWPSPCLVRGMREDGLEVAAARRRQYPLRHASTASTPGGHRHRHAAGQARCASTLGDTVTLISPARRRRRLFGTAPRIKPYKVVAVFEMGMSEYDRTMIFMPLAEAQRYFQQGRCGRRARDDRRRPRGCRRRTMAAMKQAGIPALHFADWRQRNESFFTVLEVERNVMFIILSVIVAGGGASTSFPA